MGGFTESSGSSRGKNHCLSQQRRSCLLKQANHSQNMTQCIQTLDLASKSEPFAGRQGNKRKLKSHPEHPGALLVDVQGNPSFNKTEETHKDPTPPPPPPHPKKKHKKHRLSPKKQTTLYLHKHHPSSFREGSKKKHSRRPPASDFGLKILDLLLRAGCRGRRGLLGAASEAKTRAARKPFGVLGGG